MTVQSDLEKAMAYCEAIKGSYAMMAHSTEDQQAKQMFNSMKADLEKHMEFLSGRLEYLSQNNELNKKN
ncbi:DUF1657 domain-containing protein [Clostridium formicaceticum]|uniref:Rubrerythrin family protein n=1 Tax=Clostridium formicaceticum TaxID=1497 RepID=A0AAC9RLP4_9CLOT|nr:DUF1657 domain-containing protein [Clostridium formicaceticum]AOY77119.1 rubrerythrin family protein [Clostridium formicaceticum]ARE87633.1 hypothetical protein CLFO_20330 [Clostridium formicaceticum]